MPITINRKLFKKYFYRAFYPVLAIFILLLLFFLRNFFKAFAVMVLFIVANVLIGKLRRIIRVPVEAEVVMLGTVVCTMLYGTVAGIFVALFAAVLGAITAKTLSHYTLLMVLGYIVAAFVATLFDPTNIVKAGIIITVVINVVLFLLFQVVFSFNWIKNISYAITNIVFNIFLFAYTAEPIMRLLGGI